MGKILGFLRGLFGGGSKKPVKKVEPNTYMPIGGPKETVKPRGLPYLKMLHTVVLHRGANKARFKALVGEFKASAGAYEVNTELRIAHFWAQMAHETGGFRWFKELGGREYFEKYEGRRDLGNTQKGDGYKYRGRGIIHLTGRHNYRKFGEKIGFDLIGNPDRAEDPDIAVLVALQYWKDRKLNKYADKDDIRAVTKRINGGYNGLRDRENYLKKIKGLE